uniref:Fzo/mitofusin HR2 domain-containing protein n=1 Tax=Amphimedon queenslandica TaxID=400682 RepID=A0A1X7TEP2_AMPQE
VINHLNGRFDSEINALRTSYRDVLITDIRRLLDKLNTSVNSAQSEYEATISRLTEEERNLGELQGKLHTLRNSVQLLKRDLDDFKEEYLDSVD